MISDATWSIATTDQGYRTSSRRTQRLSSEAISNVFGQFRFLDRFVLAVCIYLNVLQIFTEAAEPMAHGQIPEHGKTGGSHFYRAILLQLAMRPCTPLRDSVHGRGTLHL